MNFLITEIFKSLQAEGIMAGVPMSFVRFSGCSLGCKYCDTKYSWSKGKTMSLRDIDEELQEHYPIRWVYLTGGEVFEQPDLLHFVQYFKNKGLKIAIATNGTFVPPSWFNEVDFWVTDIKTPSAGVGNPSKFHEWTQAATVFGRTQDEIKFVVGTQEDLHFAKNSILGSTVLQTIVVSPVLIPGNSDDMSWAKEVWSFCIENNLRFSLQLHKVIFGNIKGV